MSVLTQSYQCGTWFVCSILRELAVSNLGQPLFCLSITWSRCRNAYRDLWIMTIELLVQSISYSFIRFVNNLSQYHHNNPEKHELIEVIEWDSVQLMFSQQTAQNPNKGLHMPIRSWSVQYVLGNYRQDIFLSVINACSIILYAECVVSSLPGYLYSIMGLPLQCHDFKSVFRSNAITKRFFN